MQTLEDLCAGRLAGVKRLDISAGLTVFPTEIYQLADSLEILNLSDNQLCELPDDLPRLRKLRVIFASGNRFTCLPSVLGRMPALEQIGFKANQLTTVPADALPPSLRWLILTDNALSELPATIGNCRHLRKCALAGNRLRTLPSSMQQCQALELLRISANALTAIPDWLVKLPRLAWLAYAANPGVPPLPAATLPPMHWSDLHLAEVIGDGASGVVHRATRADGTQVAIKIFKGALTSDGLPESELAAAVAAGSHPHLIGTQAVLTGHPLAQAGLVMPLLSVGWRRLAGPPSLESCTRDVYAADLRLTLPQALAIFRGICAAVAHLHQRGLLHGDVYAHNILWDGNGQACLGDFGAASALPTGQLRDLLTRCEVRALGCLLEELLTRTMAAEIPSDLKKLQQTCIAESVHHRPTAAHLHATLL